MIQQQLKRKYVTRKTKHIIFPSRYVSEHDSYDDIEESTHIDGYSWLSARYPRRGNIQTEGVSFHIQ